MINLCNDGLSAFIDKSRTKKLVCFGAGKHFKYSMSLYEDYEIAQRVAYVVDNNIELEGTTVTYKTANYSVCGISRLISENSQKIVVLITCYKYSMDILEQLDSIEELTGADVYVSNFLCDNSGYLSQEYEFEKGVTRIPKKIHYCWFGKSEIPSIYLKYMDSWKRYCPEFEIKRWDESNYDVTKNKYMKEAYEKKQWAFVSDYARLDVVNEEGGIYLDCDVEIIRDISPLLDNFFFAGFEDSNYIALGLAFGSVAGHPYLNELIRYYDGLDFINENGEYNLIPCPVYQTRIMRKFGLNCFNSFQKLENITIYPSDFFAPVSMWGKGNISVNTFSIHHYSASWQTNNEKGIKDAICKRYYDRLISNTH